MRHFSSSTTRQDRDALDARAKAIQNADPSKSYVDALAEADAEFRSTDTGQFKETEEPAHLQDGYVHGQGIQNSGKQGSAAFSGYHAPTSPNGSTPPAGAGMAATMAVIEIARHHGVAVPPDAGKITDRDRRHQQRVQRFSTQRQFFTPQRRQ